MSGYGVAYGNLIPSKNQKKREKGGIKNMQRKKLALATLSLILLICTVSATVVYYLSEKTTMTATLESPIELKLYDSDRNLITSAFTLYGGESLDFFKIAYNKATAPVPFAIVLVIEGSNGEGIIVDSAGPKVPPGDTVGAAGVPLAWNNVDLWWQNEGEAWYLHDAYNKYDEYFDDSYALWGNPQNTVYDDGGSVNIGGTDYYIVVFGGTIGAKPANGLISTSEKITNWGWGTPSGYTERATDTPLVMQGETYDVGKVRVIFAPNLLNSYTIKMQVVMPGYTVAEIIVGMFL